MNTLFQEEVSLGDFKLNDFAVIACFNVVRISGKKPETFLSEVETRAPNTAGSHSNDGKTEMQIPDANVCESAVPKNAEHKFCVRETRLHNEL